MVPPDRALATFCRPSTVTMSPSAAVWPQFPMESFKKNKWTYLGNGDEIGPRLLLITNRMWHTLFQVT